VLVPTLFSLAIEIRAMLFGREIGSRLS
jgi:hypothetical protein